MEWKLSDLPWLAPAPSDFRERCKELEASHELSGAGARVAEIAACRLNTDQLTKLSRVVSAIAQRNPGEPPGDLAPLIPLRLGVLGNATTCLYVPTLVASAARHGIALEVVQAPYDQVLQTALDPSSELNRSALDAVLLSLDYHALGIEVSAYGDAAASDAVFDRVRCLLSTIRDGISRGCAAPVIYQTVPPPPAPLFGNLDRCISGTAAQLVGRINEHIVDLTTGSTDLLFDVAGLAQNVGLEAWHDPVQWNLYKLPFSQKLVPLYSDHVARLLGAIRGRSRKCVVVDLDNTLWGGVIGDDGLDGIVLGQGDAVGEAHLALQQTLLELRKRGVILAVCSKNNDDTARLPFREHPDMILSEEDIAVFQANWTDKATNLEAIATTLNIGMDALVFVDDNPAERAQVRQALPAVAVPELPEEPALLSRALLHAGYFETLSFSDDDARRADQYQAEARRAVINDSARDLTDYLRSLEMVIGFAHFDDLGRARISQLINKSNQFNLTTRRYTEAQVGEMSTDESLFTLQVRLRDIFGDNGMICVVICRIEDDLWDVDTWLMSCRVLGRSVEMAVLNELACQARLGGARALMGRYSPTAKNALVVDHYEKLGFEPVPCEGRDTLWRLELETFEPTAVPIEVERTYAQGNRGARA